ncbi:HK97 family phage prohead protease [Spirosoma arboris]|uniref:HK97 family phage prohead protease n=1 Tax=Spirosoma arboris TaxID=2682092 RepID=UPI0012F89FF8|nr:HK97 family phage prohead protease [Spirosoma arboris]
MKFKNLNISVKDIDTVTGVTTGYLSHWYNKDSDGDFTVKGKTFVKTVSEGGPKGSGRIKHLLNHSFKSPLGVFQDLYEDNTGLGYKSQLLKNHEGVFIPDSDLVIACFVNKYGLEHSIGYKTVNEQKTADGNMLSEVMLYEGSTLTGYGANPLTPMTGLKGQFDDNELDEEDAKALYKHLESILHRDNWQDSTYEFFQSKYDELGKLLEKHKRTTQPPKDTEPDYKGFAERMKSQFTLN